MKTINQNKEDNCGPVAIYNYCKLNNISITLKQIEEICCYNYEGKGRGTDLTDIANACDLLGYKVLHINYGTLPKYEWDKYYLLSIESTDDLYHFFL